MDLVEVTSYRFARSRADLALAPGERVVAGGTWLYSEPQPGTSGLVDLTTLGWPAWEATDTGLRVAATCTVEELVTAPDEVLGSAAPLVRQCAEAFLMSFKIQALATVGGNLCLALPAGPMISLMTALDAGAVVWTADGGERRQPVAELVRDVRETSLAVGEVLRAVEVTSASLAATYAFRQLSLAPMGRSSTVVIGRASPGSFVLTVTAATTRPVVLRFPGPPEPSILRDAVAAIGCWHSDAHGAVDWRRSMTVRLAEEVMAELGAQVTR
jgi:CO/xanthine dehydrogenase FAD-binding subunit